MISLRPRAPARTPLKNHRSQHKEYFVRVVKDKRTWKSVAEFLIGWRDVPLDKDDAWESVTNLPGSDDMIAEFNN